jgi:hypothetical protein
MSKTFVWCVCLVATAAWCPCSGQQLEPADDESTERELTDEERVADEAVDTQMDEAPIKKTGDHTYVLDGITVDTAAKQIRFAAVVNQTKKELPLEVLICTEYGKTHESLFRTTISPTYLNVAFRLLDCQGGKARAGVGDPDIPVGSPVEIEVKHTDEQGQTETIQPEAWIWNHTRQAPMRDTHWTYTGSMFDMGRFMAEMTGTIVNVYIDPSTLVEPPIPEVNDDTVFGVYEEVVPPKGTKVEIIFTVLPEAPAESQASDEEAEGE